jgi:hypothetical protein
MTPETDTRLDATAWNAYPGADEWQAASVTEDTFRLTDDNETRFDSAGQVLYTDTDTRAVEISREDAATLMQSFHALCALWDLDAARGLRDRLGGMEQRHKFPFERRDR